MKSKNMLTKIAKLINETEKEYYINYSYNIVLSYLSHKYGSTALFRKYYFTIEDFAIDITANLFRKNGNGTIRLINHLNKYSKDISNETDFEFYLIKTIKEKVENTIKFEMLKNNWISIEEYYCE